MIMKKILLYGINSYKNRGVEAIVQSVLNQIDTKNNQISVACFDYDYNKNKYNEKVKKYINHYKKTEDFTKEELEELKKYDQQKFDYRNYELLHQREVVNEIEKSDICISAGGDNYCYEASEWLYAIDETVKKDNKKLVLLGASLYEEIDNPYLIKDMDLFDLLVIRESISYNELKKYINPNKIMLLPDTAFSLEAEEIKLDSWYKGRKVVGINLSPITIPNPIKDDSRFNSILNLINYILEETKYSISLISHVTTEDCSDFDTLSKIYEEYKENDRVFLEKTDYNCNQIKYIISKCELLIASRTHASIAAYSTNVPTLVIGYSVKSKGIAKDLFGTFENYVIPSTSLNDYNLVNSFKWIEKNKNNIKKGLEKITPELKEKAKSVFNEVIKKLDEQEKNICERNNCIGCGVCVNTCSKKAITLEEDGLGFKYPIIDEEKCINCGLCKKQCPINKKNKNIEFNKICYAAKNKDDKERLKSTSGGVFVLLAKSVLSKKGTVYGVEMTNNLTKHIRITNIKDLPKIIGSKYSQSSMLEILPKIKEDIKNNKLILFSGTPCQVAAIKSITNNYKNIYYVSIICHGVLNDKILKKYLEEDNINEFRYRTKDNGWSNSSVKIKTDLKEQVIKFGDCSLMNLYIQNAFLRDSCYNCKYKGDNNQADIIIGDYWGVANVHPEMFDEKGVSVIIINTKAGKKFFNESKIKNQMILVESDIKYINKYNSSIHKSPEKTMSRYTIEKDLNEQKINTIYQIDKYKSQIEELSKYKSKAEQFDLIINSRRWKITDNVFNVLNKLLGRR